MELETRDRDEKMYTERQGQHRYRDTETYIQYIDTDRNENWKRKNHVYFFYSEIIVFKQLTNEGQNQGQLSVWFDLFWSNHPTIQPSNHPSCQNNVQPTKLSFKTQI